MSKAFPTPWTFEAEDACEDSPIKAANGEYVLVRDNGVYPPDLETCREIVDAMNENDHLRNLVMRLAHVAQDTLDFAEVMCGIIPDNPERAKARSEIEALLHEAREVIGEETK